ncbi:MAG: hypothetical protein ACM3XM_03060, partial [Mycobacterium leprae]
MSFTPDQIVGADCIELPVADMPNVTRLMILTGTVAFTLKGGGADTWRRETVTFPVAQLSGSMVKGMGSASLASICNTHVARSAVWAVDQVRV